MRRLLLLAALCALAILAVAPAAMAQTVSPSASPAAVEGVPQDCDNFPTQAAAQDFLESDPSDPAGLDADDDGVACETFFGTDDDGGAEDGADDVQYEPAAAQYDTTVTPLPETGGLTPALALVPLALLVAGGLLATRIVRRG